MERLFFFVIAVALAFGVGCLGRNRFRMGFWYLTHQCGDWSHCRIMLQEENAK